MKIQARYEVWGNNGSKTELYNTFLSYEEALEYIGGECLEADSYFIKKIYVKWEI